MQKKTMCGTFLAAMAIVAHGATMLEADGLVTEKSAGWRFEASGAKGGAAFNPLEGWYPDKGGKLVSPRIAIPNARRVFVKCTVIGGALDLPILTNFAQPFKSET